MMDTQNMLERPIPEKLALSWTKLAFLKIGQKFLLEIDFPKLNFLVYLNQKI